uniref:Uncharacterized protein n=1 Tax=Rhizophora mucronata TaxID=61149 RepID=A0A2P2Q8M1_RHIMU
MIMYGLRLKGCGWEIEKTTLTDPPLENCQTS